jgi:hypothetical protein
LSIDGSSGEGIENRILESDRLALPITLDSIAPDSICYEDDSEEDTRGFRTLQNLRRYSIKSTIFNFAAAWKEMKTMTLPNGWTKLLQDMEPENNFRGFETSNFHAIIMRAGDDASESDTEQWLDNDDSDPGNQILSQEEIVVFCRARKMTMSVKNGFHLVLSYQ